MSLCLLFTQYVCIFYAKCIHMKSASYSLAITDMSLKWTYSYHCFSCSTNDKVLEEMKKEYALQEDAKRPIGV